MKHKIISKKIKILLLIIFISSLLCYISGFILLFNTGYTFSQFNKEIKSLNLSKLKFYLAQNNFDFSFNKSNLVKEYSLNDNINSLYFNLTSQNVEINTYDDETIRVEIKNSELFNTSELLTSETDNTLTFSSLNTVNSSLDVIVNIPQTLINNYNISVSTTTGDISIYNLSTDSLNLSTDSGDISLSDINVNYLNSKNSDGDINLDKISSTFESKFSLNSGELYGNGTFGFMNANNMAGDITLSLNDILKDIYITCVSGNIQLNVPSDANYKVDYSSLSGKLTSPTSSLHNKDDYNIIHITTTSGNTSIDCK